MYVGLKQPRVEEGGIASLLARAPAMETPINTVNPLLSPPGAYLLQIHLRGGLIKTEEGLI